jgi:hypothetical protein
LKVPWLIYFLIFRYWLDKGCRKWEKRKNQDKASFCLEQIRRQRGENRSWWNFSSS